MLAWLPQRTRRIRPVPVAVQFQSLYLLPRLFCRRPGNRFLSHVEHIRVRCASSGETTVSLHNVSQHPSSTPLILYIPPFSASGSSSPRLPSWLEPYPVAVLNYRWGAASSSSSFLDPHSATTTTTATTAEPSWPTPLHDTLFGYSWVVANLAPAGGGARRDVYVYGSYLGAGLAAALALTESHPHMPMAIRGLVAYNGIYDWTTFLPDHPVNRAAAAAARQGRGRGGGVDLGLTSFLQRSLEADDAESEETSPSLFRALERRMPDLFDRPSNLFDPFASASLFFLSPGLLVPPEFGQLAAALLPSSFLSAVDALSSSSSSSSTGEQEEDVVAVEQVPPKHPRVGYLTFPPRSSTLKIPETLLLHETPPPPLYRAAAGRRRSRSRSLASSLASASAKKGKKKRSKATRQPNSFAAQAHELARLMRRSVETVELRERVKWGDEEVDDDAKAAAEVERRVQVADAGSGLADEKMMGGIGGEAGEERVVAWLEERMGRV